MFGAGAGWPFRHPVVVRTCCKSRSRRRAGMTRSIAPPPPQPTMWSKHFGSLMLITVPSSRQRQPSVGSCRYPSSGATSTKGRVLTSSVRHRKPSSHLPPIMPSPKICTCRAGYREGKIAQAGSCMDAPSNAITSFGHAGQCDQVPSCIRPLDAASQRAAGQYGDTRTRSNSVFRALSPDSGSWFSRPRLNDRLPLPVLRPAHIHHAITSGRNH